MTGQVWLIPTGKLPEIITTDGTYVDEDGAGQAVDLSEFLAIDDETWRPE